MIYGTTCTLRREDRFFIYGAATTGGTLYENLLKNGFSVVAFMDQRAYEIEEYHGLPVLSMSEGQALSGEKDIVILAIKNVFEHEKIAKKLLSYGFRRVLFRPYRVICGEGTELDWMLDRAYDKILYDKISREEKDMAEISFPTISQSERLELQDHGILSDEGAYVVANIPLAYVFTDIKGVKTRWTDIPCLGLLPHIGLFETFNGRWNRNYPEYIKFCHESAERRGGIVTSKAWEKSVYQNRMDVFLHMQYSWEHDPDFFVRNAVEGIYNPKGYFNIVSGKHRITYMLIKGRRYIPLRIKKENYLKWRDQAQAERILAFIEKNESDSLPLILRNPFFYDYASASTSFYEKLLHILIFQVFQRSYDQKKDFDFRGKSILFYNTPLALYADIFLMLGFSVLVVEKKEERKQLLGAVLPDICVSPPEILEKAPVDCYIAVLQEQEDCAFQKIGAQMAVLISSKYQGKQEILSGISYGELLHAGLNISEDEKE